MSINHNCCSRLIALCGVLLITSLARGDEAEPAAFKPIDEKGAFVFASDPNVEMRLGGPVGERIDNNISEWVLRAPKANPILLSIFSLRDRKPETNAYYVPWVGEFIGKFLTNSIAVLRLSDRPELEETVRVLVEELMASQSPEGYLGPFPKDKRLMVCWDLWGHYHAITALLMWYERTGDERAFETCIKAADFICGTFLDTGHRMKDVGSHEMNLSIITSFCQLYRMTGNPRYFRMANEILQDWEDTGDYYRSGLAGVEFYQTPRPRWESIHCLLGLPELYRITGEESYKTAYLNLWRSALTLEVHNNGSFSTDEETIGHPFGTGPIETCCTVAWMAMTTETLRMTGSPEAADALEAATYNTVMAYQNPSGSWSTYHTPMNGRREASFHSIVFQSRPGQPELNCCSVNAPRGLALVSEWGLMKGTDTDGKESLVINYYGPGTMTTTLGGEPVTVTQKTSYPLDGEIEINIQTKQTKPFTVLVRVPRWAEGGTVRTAAGDETLTPGTYWRLSYNPGSTGAIRLSFPMPLRYESGDLAFADTMSIYRGPILLAYDQRYNEFENDAIPAVTPDLLEKASVEFPPKDERAELFGAYTPMLRVTIPAEKPLVLTDFATAGVLGTVYVSWIPARDILPPVPACVSPKKGQSVPASGIRFAWRTMAHPQQYTYTVTIAETPDLARPVVSVTTSDARRLILSEEDEARLTPDRVYYWGVTASNEQGSRRCQETRSFKIDPSLPPGAVSNPLLVADDLAGEVNPSSGKVAEVVGAQPCDGPEGSGGAVRLDGESGIITYQLEEFPEEFTLSVDFCLDAFPDSSRIGEIVSAWCRGWDDPLRVFMREDQIFGKIESSHGGQIDGPKLELGRWYHLSVTQDHQQYLLYLDDQLIGHINGSGEGTASRMISLGGNPLYRQESEFTAARFARFRFVDQAQE
ncbi:MAG: glycoside hydrolase family 127 protein [Thermoguttaceae bacterium]|nr:glycoside hydrolase family 127 protein [Thermoguttaceae bacterium]